MDMLALVIIVLTFILVVLFISHLALETDPTLTPAREPTWSLLLLRIFSLAAAFVWLLSTTAFVTILFVNDPPVKPIIDKILK